MRREPVSSDRHAVVKDRIRAGIRLARGSVCARINIVAADPARFDVSVLRPLRRFRDLTTRWLTKPAAGRYTPSTVAPLRTLVGVVRMPSEISRTA